MGRKKKKKAKPKAPEAASDGRSALGEWAKSFAIAFVLFLLIRSFLLTTFVIISESMEETVLVGDLLLANRAAVGTRIPGTSWRIPGYTDLRRGDVVVFDPHHEEDLKLVKRLMGLPGDTVEMRNKVLIVNGVALDEPYVRHTDLRDDPLDPAPWRAQARLEPPPPESAPATRDTWGPLVVPPDHYFMLGDNRDTSLDSRYWGFLESWRVEGRVFLIYFSYNRGSLRPFPWLREIRWGRLGDRVR
jgi:signal peptidase I